MCSSRSSLIARSSSGSMRPWEIWCSSLFMYAVNASRSRQRLTITISAGSRSDCHTWRSTKPSASSTRCARRRKAVTSSTARPSSTRSRESDTYMPPRYPKLGSRLAARLTVPDRAPEGGLALDRAVEEAAAGDGGRAGAPPLPAATCEVLDCDLLRRPEARSRPHLEPHPGRRAALDRPDRQPVCPQPGLRLAAQEAQTGLERAAAAVVAHLVLRDRADAGAAPRHEVRLVDPLGLVSERRAGEAIGRIRLHPELGAVDRQPAGDPMLPRGAIDPQRQPADLGQSDVAGTDAAREALARAARVRVVRDGVHVEPLEAGAATHARRRPAQLATPAVEAEEVAVEGDRRDRSRGVAAARAADPRRLANEDRVAGVAARAQRRGGRPHEVAVHPRRVRNVAAAYLAPLRREPAALVGLVPHRPAMHGRIAACERRHELLELRRLRLADASDRVRARASRRPGRAGSSRRELHLHAARGGRLNQV